jgi:hypothetical protein
MRHLVVVLMLSSCATTGPELIDCNGNGEAGIERARAFFSTTVVERVDVFCKRPEDIPEKVPCVTYWQGSSTHRARYIADVNLVDRCIVHEAHHSQLWEKTGNACVSHSSSCGWDTHRLDDASRGLPK